MSLPTIVICSPGARIDIARPEHSFFARSGTAHQVRLLRADGSWMGDEWMLADDIARLDAERQYEVRLA